MGKAKKEAVRTTTYLTKNAKALASRNAGMAQLSVSEYLESLIFKDEANSNPAIKLALLEAKEQEIKASLDEIQAQKSDIIKILAMHEEMKIGKEDLEKEAIKRIKRKIQDYGTSDEILRIATHFGLKLSRDPNELIYKAREAIASEADL